MEIAPYAEARERVQTELYLMAALRETVRPQLVEAAQQSGLHDVDESQIDLALNTALQAISVEVDSTEGTVRHIAMGEGGVYGGKLVRLRNITLDTERLMKFAGSTLLNLATNPILLPFSVLLAILELRNLTEVSINEQEATVFWGLLHACGRPNHPTKEHEVFERINKERTKHGLVAELTENQIQASLEQLTRLGVVERVEGRYPMWQFVESCRIR